MIFAACKKHLDIQLLLLLLVTSHPLVAMDQAQSHQDLWAFVKSHPAVMVASATLVTSLGIAWLVTEPARDRKYQAQLSEVLRTATDKDQLTNAFKHAKDKMPLILRCNQAAESGDVSLVKLCFELGVKPTDLYKFSQCDTNETAMPLWNAMCYGKADIVALCMKHGVTAFTLIDKKPALLRAFEICSMNHMQKMNVMTAFLERTQDDITAIFERKDFEWGYGQSGSVAKCMPLLARVGQAKAIAWLLKRKKIPVNEPDAEGFKAVHRAAQSGKTEVLKVLVPRDKYLALLIGPNNVTPIMLAAAGGHVEAIEFLWQDGYHPGAVDWDHMTPLAHAAANGHLSAMQKLVTLMKRDFTCPLDGPFFDTATPLHHALYKEKFDCASYLIEQGASVALVDDKCNIPLHVAAFKKDCPSKLMKLLILKSLEKGVLATRNADEQTALDIALISGSEEVQHMLREAGISSSLVLRKFAQPKEKHAHK